jgi:hypothetical protein
VVNLEKALKVDGWMNEAEMTWLVERAREYHFIVEVGSWMGRTTRALIDNCPGIVYAVDTWDGSEENQEFLKDKPNGFLYQKFLENLEGTRVIPMRMPSVAAAAHFANAKMQLGMVFIDGAHDEQSVRNDILAWRPLVKDGGLLCGHDYDWGWPGVVHAVRELISPTPNQVGGSSLWYQYQ